MQHALFVRGKTQRVDTQELFDIETRTRSDQIRERILALIREGHLKPGDKLPTQRELAKRFGVGMSSIREAIQSLVGFGALETRHGAGVFVKKVSLRDITTFIGQALDFSVNDALQLIEARAIIEVNAARLAAERHSPEDLQSMMNALEDTRQYIERDDLEHLIEADIAFHAAIVRGSHNEVLSTMLRSVEGLLRRDRLESYRHGYGPGGIVLAHEVIYEAIRAGDPERAARLIEQHLSIIRQQRLRREQG